MGRFKPPLTNDDLVAIQERNPRVKGDQASDDLYALLWEIKRLQVVALRAHQLQATLGNQSGSLGLILMALREELAIEPCVLEQERMSHPPQEDEPD